MNSNIIKTLLRCFAHYVKTVTVYTYLISHFNKHSKSKNEVEIEILTFKILTKIACNLKRILNVICFKMSFVHSALFSYLINVSKLN